MVQKRICVLTRGGKAGRLRASEAVQRALYSGSESVEVKVLDAHGSGRPWVHRVSTSWYAETLRWMGRLLRGRRGQNRPTAMGSTAVERGGRELWDHLNAYAPQLIVGTEAGITEVAALGRREGLCMAPILAVQTDFDIPASWVQPEIAAYCVADEDARARLLGWGVAPSRILLCGLPVDPAFAFPFDKHEVAQALGLDPRRPVVLAMGSGAAPMPLDRVVGALEHCNEPMQVLAVAGHDGVLLRRLELLRGRLAMDLHVFGWSENIPELMAVSDLLIATPASVIAAEALAAGLPMILTPPRTAPQELHSRHLCQQGVALCAEALNDIPRMASSLLSRPQELHEMRKRTREWSRPEAAQVVAQVAMALLERATYFDLLATPTPPPGESAYLM